MRLDLQIASDATYLPESTDFIGWCEAALTEIGHDTDIELTIRLCENDEIQQLNRDYRGKDKPTNVLSFPFEPIAINPMALLTAYAGDVAQLDLPLLGDIIMAPAVIAAEAQAQNKVLLAHFAHMSVHGVLHLLGYDHIEDDQAETMEALEIRILQRLNISNPYQ